MLELLLAEQPFDVARPKAPIETLTPVRRSVRGKAICWSVLNGLQTARHLLPD